MKAIVYHRYGSPDVLELAQVAKPEPGPGDVLVRVRAASVNAGDWHLMRGEPFLVRLVFGLRKPRAGRLGSDIAGTVEAVGHDVKELQPGDDVFGVLSESGFGAFADYACLPARWLVTRPAEVSFEEAAAVPTAALAALQALRDKGRIQAGQSVLVNGASGGVGTFAVQLARAFGARVTGVCSTRNLDLVRSLGAEAVIDYTREDYTRSGRSFDLIVDAAAHRPPWEARRALSPGGIYVMVGGATGPTLQMMFVAPLVSMAGGNKLEFLLSKPSHDDLVVLKDLLEAGKIRPVIDRRFPLEQVPEAIRHLEGGHPTGKVLIQV